MEQKQAQEKLWVASGKAGTLQDFLMGRGGVGDFSTLFIPGREQEAAVLLLLFCSCQMALTPGWVYWIYLFEED